jgi:hypothetical protein
MVLRHNVIPIPSSEEEAAISLSRIAEIDQKLRQQHAKIAAQITALQGESEAYRNELLQDRGGLETGLKTFITLTHPESEENGVSINLSTGTIGRRGKPENSTFFIEPNPLPNLEIEPLDSVAKVKPA